MALYDCSLKAAYFGRDCGVVLDRNRMMIEEAPAVIELDLACWRQLRESIFDLMWNRAERNGLHRCILPEVAHQATPGTLAICKEDGRYWNHFPVCGTLSFYQKGIGFRGIYNRAGWALIENPLITF